MQASKNWDLETLFQRSSFPAFLKQLREEVEQFEKLASAETDLKVLIDHYEKVEASDAWAYVHCLTAQNVNDFEAQNWLDEVELISSKYKTAIVAFDEKLKKMSAKGFESVLMQFPDYAFILNEKRERSKDKLNVAEENLINTLSVDGFNAWSELYTQTVGKMEVKCTINGEEKNFSVAQAANFLQSFDRNVRKSVASAFDRAFDEKKELFAAYLNRISGFRLKVCELRGKKSFLHEPLQLNRLSQKTLETMWSAVESGISDLKLFLEKKAKLMKVEKLDWDDLEVAHFPFKGKVPYEEAVDIAATLFSKFSLKMGEYAKKAFETRSIEAENRKDKLPGGFCTAFPGRKASRIFMTYSDTFQNLMTLAHELGHGYHNEMLFGLPPLLRHIPMTLAETASTFAEQVVSDGLLESCKTKEERLPIIEERVIRSLLLLMNIRCRYIFEKKFYELRQKGMLSADKLSELMLEAQEKAFDNSLNKYHPLFWASKGHFYSTGMPFYNFPYTFGYLFSFGLYALAKEEGTQKFSAKYEAILKDTGRMTVEEIAKRHLEVDLTQPAFWEKAVRLSTEDARFWLENSG